MRRRLLPVQTLLGVLLPLLAYLSGLAAPLADACRAAAGNWWGGAALSFTAWYLLAWLFLLPLKLYSGHVIEQRFGLAAQTLARFFGRALKELLLGLVLTVGMLLLLWYGMQLFGTWWWLAVAILFFLLTVLLAELAPLLVIPLFYKTTPLPDGALRTRLEQFLRAAGLGQSTLLQFDLGRETKKANALFTGWGKARRVLLADTLVARFTPAEVEVVLAHELGHRHHHHIARLLLLGFAGSVLQFWLLDALLRAAGPLPPTLAQFPLLWLGFALLALVAQPLQAAYSRHCERQADAFACATPVRAAAFADALQRLGDTNLADPDPPRWQEWYYYSHPALARRIAAARRRT